MTDERVERRLAAVLAADVGGYSRLMGSDEEGTLARLKAVRKALVDPTIATHRGRIVKTTGDGMLVEFASAVDAVRGAVEIQGGMAELNASVPQDQRMEFRIGIHVGDIIIDDHDIFGDGVNVAARVENECDPGSVCVSGNAFEQIRGKTSFKFEDRGEKKLKNIERSVRLYSVRGPTSATTASAMSIMSSENSKPLPLPNKPSIAVLPFQNMSGDPEQEYFADGMVEDIITALSRFNSLFVIARNSSFTYKNKAVDIREVGRQLGVRYVLEGSVRKSGGRVRITGQLIEASTNKHLWADKFDGVLEEIFDLQDQVSSSVVARLVPKLEEAEHERISRVTAYDPNTYDLFLRGMAGFYGGDPRVVLDIFKSVIAFEPKFAAAHAMAAASLVLVQARGGVQLASDLQTSAIAFARQGANLGANDAFSLARSGHALAYLGREYDLGLALLDRSISLNPNLGLAWLLHGNTSVLCSEFDRAVESYNRIMRLSPLDPLMPHILQGRSFALAGLDRFEEGYIDAVSSLQLFEGMQGLGALITNGVLSGRLREAREAAQRLLALQPKFRLSAIGNTFHTKNALMMKRLIDTYRVAGLPE